MVLQASFLDGQRKKSDKEWQKMKHVSELKVQRARAFKQSDKAAISAEIDKVTKVSRKKKKRAIDTIFKG